MTKPTVSKHVTDADVQFVVKENVTNVRSSCQFVQYFYFSFMILPAVLGNFRWLTAIVDRKIWTCTWPIGRKRVYRFLCALDQWKPVIINMEWDMPRKLTEDILAHWYTSVVIWHNRAWIHYSRHICSTHTHTCRMPCSLRVHQTSAEKSSAVAARPNLVHILFRNVYKSQNIVHFFSL